MTIELISTILSILGISNVITFFLTKKRYNTEVDSQQIKNMNDSFDVYKKMMEQSLESQKKIMEETINAQNNTIKAQDSKIEALQKENEVLKEQVGKLQMQLIQFLGKSYNPDSVD